MVSSGKGSAGKRMHPQQGHICTTCCALVMMKLAGSCLLPTSNCRSCPDQPTLQLHQQQIQQAPTLLRFSPLLPTTPNAMLPRLCTDAIFIRNATHDLFWTSWSEHFEPHQISYHYHRHEQLPYRVDVMQNDHPSRHGHIDNPLLIVQFVWDTSESRTSYQDVKDAFRSSGTMHAVYVPGIHYWCGRID